MAEAEARAPVRAVAQRAAVASAVVATEVAAPEWAAATRVVEEEVRVVAIAAEAVTAE